MGSSVHKRLSQQGWFVGLEVGTQLEFPRCLPDASEGSILEWVGVPLVRLHCMMFEEGDGIFMNNGREPPLR